MATRKKKATKAANRRELVEGGIMGLIVVVMIGVALAMGGTAPSGGGRTWVGVEKMLAQSVARLDLYRGEEQGVCTAFSINENRAFFLTAAHCVTGSERMMLEGQETWVTFLSEEHDLAVMLKPGASKPALHPRISPVGVGTEAGAYGYGYGWTVAQLRVGKVAGIELPLAQIEQEGTDTLTMFDQGFVMGQSGGPLVDANGSVIALIQMGDPSGGVMGLGRSIDIVYEATKQYWEYKR